MCVCTRRSRASLANELISSFHRFFESPFVTFLCFFQVYSIHGKMKRKNDVITKFKSVESGVLICTDVLARGMDIPEVHWVIQYDPPTSAATFVHR